MSVIAEFYLTIEGCGNNNYSSIY